MNSRLTACDRFLDDIICRKMTRMWAKSARNVLDLPCFPAAVSARYPLFTVCSHGLDSSLKHVVSENLTTNTFRAFKRNMHYVVHAAHSWDIAQDVNENHTDLSEILLLTFSAIHAFNSVDKEKNVVWFCLCAGELRKTTEPIKIPFAWVKRTT